MTKSQAAAAVHFDLDGTLVESEGPYPLADVAARVGATVDDEQVATFRSLVVVAFRRDEPAPYRRAAERWAAHYELDLDPAALSAAFERRQVDRSRPVDGVAGMLDSLGDDLSLGLLSNGSGPVQRGKLERHGLDGAFESVVVSGETPYMKPDDGLFALARERLPAPAHVYVADRLAFDLVPARENGFRGVWVGERETPLADRTVESAASLTVEAIRDLVESEAG